MVLPSPKSAGQMEKGMAFPLPLACVHSPVWQPGLQDPGAESLGSWVLYRNYPMLSSALSVNNYSLLSTWLWVKSCCYSEPAEWLRQVI